jgi:hypothetical protein
MEQNRLLFIYGVAAIAGVRKVSDALVRLLKWRDELYVVEERLKGAIAVMPAEYWFSCFIVARADSWPEWKKVDYTPTANHRIR